MGLRLSLLKPHTQLYRILSNKNLAKGYDSEGVIIMENQSKFDKKLLENCIAGYLVSGQYKIVGIGRSYKDKKSDKERITIVIEGKGDILNFNEK